MAISEARRVYDAASATRRLGSRISRKQVEAVELAVTDEFVADPDHLANYALTGDAGYMTDGERIAIHQLVEAAKDHLETDSQKRRLWPRKVAAIVSL